MPELVINTTMNPWPLETPYFFSLVADLLAFPQRRCSIRSCRRRHHCSYVVVSETMPACLDYADEDDLGALAAIGNEYTRLTEALLFDRLPSPVDLPNDPVSRETLLTAAEILARRLPPDVDVKSFHQWRKACLQARATDPRL